MTAETNTALARRDVEAAGLSMAGALLPANYEHARTALAECARIDVCKEWADRAEALRSYARQADDPTLLNHAMRIKARAVRRCGELLATIETTSNLKRGPDYAELNSGTRREAAADNGLNVYQQSTAIRVARVPSGKFESMVEAANPPSVTQLADMGRKKRSSLGDTDDDEDSLSTSEADRALKVIAKRARHDVFDPPPGILACLIEAMSRASAADRATIVKAAAFFSALAGDSR